MVDMHQAMEQLTREFSRLSKNKDKEQEDVDNQDSLETKEQQVQELRQEENAGKIAWRNQDSSRINQKKSG